MEDPIDDLVASRQESEPPPGRRLVAFAALFLGLLTLNQANFASSPPLLAPGVVMVIVLLVAGAGVLVWLDARLSRALLWPAAGLAMVSAAAAALLHAPPAWLAGVLLASAACALFAAAIVSASLFRPTLPFGRVVPGSRWVVVIAGMLLLLATTPLPGPLLAMVTAFGALIVISLLRPPGAGMLGWARDRLRT